MKDKPKTKKVKDEPEDSHVVECLEARSAAVVKEDWTKVIDDEVLRSKLHYYITIHNSK